MEGVVFSVAIICLVYLGIPYASNRSCIAAINTEYRDMTCPIQAGQGIRWLAEVNGSPETIATCDAAGVCTNKYPDVFAATLQNLTTRLIIKNTSRTFPFDMGTNWTCNYIKDNQNQNVCSPLTVVERLLGPVCEPHTLNNKTYGVSVTCHVARAYPLPSCDMFLSKENGTTRQETADGLNIEKKYVLVNTTPEYFRMSCTVTVPISSLGTRGFFYSIRIYPLVDGIAILELAVQTELKLIRIGLIEDEEPVKYQLPTDEENGWLIIGLAVALTVAIVIVVLFVLRECRTRQKRHPNIDTAHAYDHPEEPANRDSNVYENDRDDETGLKRVYERPTTTTSPEEPVSQGDSHVYETDRDDETDLKRVYERPTTTTSPEEPVSQGDSCSSFRPPLPLARNSRLMPTKGNTMEVTAL